MSGPRSIRARADTGDYWPGFVDALATLLLVIIFLLSLFVLAQFALSQALNDRDEEVSRLTSQIAQLADQLALAEDENANLTARLSTLQATLEEKEEALTAALSRGAGLAADLEDAEELTEEQANELAILNQQIAALNEQLRRLEASLQAAEERDAEQKAEIANLGKRLNQALASEVARLAAYRSEFFEKLMQALEGRTDVRVVGDRFVFETDVLFDSASDELKPAGQQQLAEIADAINEISGDIPDDINWVIRVDGHTDERAINTAQFPSNWHLSAARAISVVNYFTDQGVPADRLVAAGFGEHHPIARGDSEAAYSRNRRIELKLTSR